MLCFWAIFMYVWPGLCRILQKFLCENFYSSKDDKNCKKAVFFDTHITNLLNYRKRNAASSLPKPIRYHIRAKLQLNNTHVDFLHSVSHLNDDLLHHGHVDPTTLLSCLHFVCFIVSFSCPRKERRQPCGALVSSSSFWNPKKNASIFRFCSFLWHRRQLYRDYSFDVYNTNTMGGCVYAVWILTSLPRPQKTKAPTHTFLFGYPGTNVLQYACTTRHVALESTCLYEKTRVWGGGRSWCS